MLNLFIFLCFFLLPQTDSEVTAEDLRRLGIQQKNDGDFLKALEYYQQALVKFTEDKDPLGQAKVLNNIGTVWFYINDFKNAITAYNQSERLFNTLNNTAGLANVNVGLGNYYMYEEKNFSLSLEKFQTSLGAYRSLENTWMEMVTLNNIGNVYSYEDANNDLLDVATAISYYHQALTLARNMEDSLQIGGIFMNLGQSHEMSSPDSAFYYYHAAEEIFDALKNPYKLASVYLNLGLFEVKRTQYNTSIPFSETAFKIANKENYWDFIHGASKNLSLAYESIQELDSALKYLKIHSEYNDSIYNESRRTAIENLKISYETEKKEKEIELRTAENRTLMTTLLVAVGFTIIVIVFYQQRQKALRSLRERDTDLRLKEQELHQQQVDQMVREQELKSINAMLEGEEKERKRIAEDLHDRVGSMLSAMKLQTDTSDEKMTGLLDETVEEVRRISHNLETKVLNRFGLVAALEDLAEKINTSEKIHFELQHLDLSERLDNKVEINSYRIVQELVSNALKHSKATEITTQVNRIDNQLIITVEDNGVGFDSLEAREKATGMGLKNIMSRANELNGNFNIDSGKGNGTTITVDFPL